MSNAIVTKLANDELVTTSMAIAENANYPHSSVIKLIRKSINDLEKFGRVRFEIQPFETAGGTQQREISFLNEQQATLLLTYMRNNDIVRVFKMRLVEEFYKMRAEVLAKLPDFTNPVEAARAWADAKEAEMVAVSLVEEKQKQIEENAPKVGFYNTVTQAPDTYDMSQVAKVINLKGMGRNKLIDWLRKQKVFRPNTTEPYQFYVDKGYFKIATTHKSGNIYPKTVAYQRGVDFIIRLLRDNGYSV